MKFVYRQRHIRVRISRNRIRYLCNICEIPVTGRGRRTAIYHRDCFREWCNLKNSFWIKKDTSIAHGWFATWLNILKQNMKEKHKNFGIYGI